MEEYIIIIYVQDTEYGKRLLHFLSAKKNPQLYPELATDKSKVKYRVGTKRQKLVILTDCEEFSPKETDFDKGFKEEYDNKKILYLSNRQDREHGIIFQFQKAEGIYRELLWQLKLQPEKVPVIKQESQEADRGIYLIMSPGGGGTTVISTMFAQYLGQRGQCLYLDMSGFPVYYNGEMTSGPELTKSGVVELFFALGQRGFKQREREIRQPFGKAWMISPMTHFKDLIDCAAEDWKVFLETLTKDCGYDSIVIEMGLLYEHTLDIMSLADYVFLLKEDGVQGRIRKEVYERYCKLDQKEILLKKTQYIPITSRLSDWARDLEQESLEQLADHPQKMAYAEKIITGEEKDVCIFEDIG